MYGIRFVVETDHKPLEVICGTRSRPCSRLEQWLLRLQPYDFSVVHRPRQGIIADPLSRLLRREVKPNNHQQSAEEYVRFVAVNASAFDEELVEVRKAITTGQFEKCMQYMAVAGESCVIGQLALRGTRIVIPKKATTKDPSSRSWRTLGSGGHQTEPQDPGLMASNRQSSWQALPGMPWMSVSGTAWPPEPIRSIALPDGPWQDLAVDLMGPLPSGHSLLVFVDYYSRFYDSCNPLPSM